MVRLSDGVISRGISPPRWAAEEQAQGVMTGSEYGALPPQDPPEKPFYETDPVTPIEVHALRWGDVALASNLCGCRASVVSLLDTPYNG